MNKKSERYVLKTTTVAALLLLPFAIVKRSFKDWIIVHLVSYIGNSLADRYLVSKGYLKYNTRPYPNKFLINVPFDFLVYPLLLLYYNQATLNSRPFNTVLKLFPFVLPQMAVETILEKKTDLIQWRKGWSWQHSLVSLLAKFLLCRLIIGLIRTLNNRNLSI